MSAQINNSVKPFTVYHVSLAAASSVIVDLKGWSVTGYATSDDAGITSFQILPMLPFTGGDVESSSALNTSTNKTKNTYYGVTSGPQEKVKLKFNTAVTVEVLLFLTQ